MWKRLKNILIGLDQFAWTVVTLGSGSPDESISAAAWRLEQEGRVIGKILRPLIDLLASPFEKQHCYKSWLSEVTRSQLPTEYRDKN